MQRRQPDIPFTTEYTKTNMLLHNHLLSWRNRLNRRSIFRTFGESSRYVRWCLEQLATHNAEHWSRIISAFHQALALQAHDVIKAFQPKSFS